MLRKSQVLLIWKSSLLNFTVFVMTRFPAEPETQTILLFFIFGNYCWLFLVFPNASSFPFEPSNGVYVEFYTHLQSLPCLHDLLYLWASHLLQWWFLDPYIALVYLYADLTAKCLCDTPTWISHRHLEFGISNTGCTTLPNSSLSLPTSGPKQSCCSI